MNKAVFQHYEQLLAEHYSWMFGVPFRTKVDEQLDAFKTLDVEPGKHGVAVDLGSGPGFQSIALAELGFKTVIAIDSSPKLLAELNSHKGSLPIRTEIADLREFDKLVSPGSAEVIVCMGDTLTHLDSPEDVEAIFEKARDCLRASGILVLTFRDMSEEVIGLDRFVPVRSDDNRIMMCMLEYRRDVVDVTDLVHTREASGWLLNKSSYRKLRLAPVVLAEKLANLGLKVVRNEPLRRMHMLAATK